MRNKTLVVALSVVTVAVLILVVYLLSSSHIWYAIDCMGEIFPLLTCGDGGNNPIPVYDSYGVYHTVGYAILDAVLTYLDM